MFTYITRPVQVTRYTANLREPPTARSDWQRCKMTGLRFRAEGGITVMSAMSKLVLGLTQSRIQ
jgi:hypothetical protein